MGGCYSVTGEETLQNETIKKTRLLTFGGEVDHSYKQSVLSKTKFFEYDIKFDLPASNLSWLLFELNDSTNVINSLDKTFPKSEILDGFSRESNGEYTFAIKIKSDVEALIDEILLRNQVKENPLNESQLRNFSIEQWTISKKQMKKMLQKGAPISGKLSRHFDGFAGSVKLNAIEVSLLSIELNYKMKEHHVNMTTLDEASGRLESADKYRNRFFIFLNRKIEAFVDFVLKVNEKEFDVRDLAWINEDLEGVQEGVDMDAERFRQLFAEGKLRVSEELGQRLGQTNESSE